MTPLTAYFVAPDGYGEPTIWRGKPGDERPQAVMCRDCHDRAFFDDVAAAIADAHMEAVVSGGAA